MEMFSTLAATAIANARLVSEKIETERLAAIGQAVHPLAHDRYVGMIGQRPFDLSAEDIAVNRHRAAGRHPGNFARAHDDAIERAHFMVQQAHRVLAVVIRPERIRADQLRQPVCLVGRGHLA